MQLSLCCEHPGCNTELGTVTFDDVTDDDIRAVGELAGGVHIEAFGRLIADELFGEHPPAVQLLARRLHRALCGYRCEHHPFTDE
jgi:hypothetical protein